MRPILDHDASLEYPRDGAGAPTTGNGPLRATGSFRDKHIQFMISGGWDVDLIASVDGAVFQTLAANVIADTLISVPLWYKYMRVVVNTVPGGPNPEDLFSVYCGGFQEVW